MPYLGVTPHLVPFLPYIEKADDSPLDEAWRPVDSLSRPINVSTIEAWLRECNQNHQCNRKGRDGSGGEQRPAWVIDVKNRCIARCEGEQYVALSYVWGQRYDSSVCLVKENLPTLLRPGSLEAVALPGTITDALDLVAELGVGYLWVDRLCIVQNDHQEKERQLQGMAGIYEEAYFTLIAAQSLDASGPLSSRPLKHDQDDTPWRRPANNREVMNSHSIDLLRTVWFSRGWTFQEYLFSGRKVVFHNNTVNWECGCASWHEHQWIRHTIPVDYNTPRFSRLDPWPNFHRFARLSSLFSPRFFTYPEDVHDAFAGAGNHFAASFPGGLISGLPGGCFFDAALLWQPYSPMERRVASLKIAKGTEVLPSWSWLTYRGNIQSESWAAGWSYLASSKREGGWQVFPTVNWDHSETRDGPRSPASVLETAPEMTNEGWTESDGCYTHPSISRIRFARPIPLPYLEQPQKAVAHRSRYLHCETWHCTWKLYKKAYHAFAGDCAILALLDLSGNLAGHLRVNMSESQIRNQISTEPIDLIELSRGEAQLQPQSPEPAQWTREERLDMPQQDLAFRSPVPLMEELGASEREEKALVRHPLADVFDEWSLRLWPSTRNKGLYEFYNVMWVKWLDDGEAVAERLAIGRIEKMAWERKDKTLRQITIA
ncbi:heterokaryon incompatibility protein-domain-containing protein [Triangularia verruculosa]|uniref:Heterokaryon incompatibility protein-domain-containing protein n=1 Tax=Triangularia verruculosa TaxID=2587418 RepID=A0AAN6X7B8_9PEZI|nr:heterokaryon incompatibility protein-domain-containing protein [Triangularia verruculosa]